MAYNLVDILGIPAQALLEYGISQSSTATALCQRLEGKKVAFDTGIEGLNAFFAIEDNSVSLLPGAPEEPDVTITGTPISLVRLIARESTQAGRYGAIKMSGDVDVATDFQALLEMASPDLEEELSKVTGDVIAHETFRAMREAVSWAAGMQETLGRSLAEYLTEELRELVAEAEVEEFCSEVDELAVAVDRFEARLGLLSGSGDRN